MENFMKIRALTNGFFLGILLMAGLTQAASAQCRFGIYYGGSLGQMMYNDTPMGSNTIEILKIREQLDRPMMGNSELQSRLHEKLGKLYDKNKHFVFSDRNCKRAQSQCEATEAKLNMPQDMYAYCGKL